MRGDMKAIKKITAVIVSALLLAGFLCTAVTADANGDGYAGSVLFTADGNTVTAEAVVSAKNKERTLYICSYGEGRLIEMAADKKVVSGEVKLHADTLIPLAKLANVDFIWVHGASTVLEATFAHSLNSIGTPTLVVEMGVSMRLTKAYGDQLVDGIFNLMKEMGIWTGDVTEVREPVISKDPDDVCFLNASSSGLFIPEVKHGARLYKGDLIGKIVDPLCGSVLDEVRAPIGGMLFTIRDYPIVDEGSLMGRILRDGV